MARKRVILEMGTGNDLHGGDYIKAALRAVQDALHHSSLSMIRSLGIDAKPHNFGSCPIFGGELNGYAVFWYERKVCPRSSAG